MDLLIHITTNPTFHQMMGTNDGISAVKTTCKYIVASIFDRHENDMDSIVVTHSFKADGEYGIDVAISNAMGLPRHDDAIAIGILAAMELGNSHITCNVAFLSEYVRDEVEDDDDDPAHLDRRIERGIELAQHKLYAVS